MLCRRSRDGGGVDPHVGSYSQNLLLKHCDGEYPTTSR